MKSYLYLILGFVCAAAASVTARGATLTVSSASDSGTGTLRAAADQAAAGDTINFHSGLSGQTITLSSGPITLGVNVTIDASALKGIVISGASASRIFVINAEASVTLKALTLEKGLVTGDVGGAILNLGSLTALNCIFGDNAAFGGNGQTPLTLGNGGGGGGGGAGMGGAIYSSGASLTLNGCTFQGNVAHGGNGGDGDFNNQINGIMGGNGGGPNGGAGSFAVNGGEGGFGGGGGGTSGIINFSNVGGDGGFGGGGGGACGGDVVCIAGLGGTFGGGGNNVYNLDLNGAGGGGAGLGGAVFLFAGVVTITNCSLADNEAVNGLGGAIPAYNENDVLDPNYFVGASPGGNGQGVGGGIFNYNATLSAGSNTFFGNMASSIAPNQYPVFAFGVSSLLVGPGGSANSLVLSAPVVEWGASSSAPWLHISNEYGTGSTNLFFNCDPNAGPTRQATIYLNGGTPVSIACTVTQAGSTYIQAPGPLTTLVSSGLNRPGGLAVDGSGHVYIADTGNNAIKEWNPATGTTGTLISTGLSGPLGVAPDTAGNVYIADSSGNAVQEWIAASGQLNTIAAQGLGQPSGVAVDSSGNVYFSDTQAGALDEWVAAVGAVNPLAGGLLAPSGVALDAAGNLYFAARLSQIGEFQPGSGLVSTLVSAGLNQPRGVAVDGAGNLYIADTLNSAVKEWILASNQVVTLAAFGLNEPGGVAVDGAGNLYIADTLNNAIKEIPYAFVDPTARAEVAGGGSDSLPMVLPSTRNLSPPFAPASDQPWLVITGVANGVVSFSFSANTDIYPRAAHITLLGQAILITQYPSLAGALTVTNATDSGSRTLRELVTYSVPGDTIVFAPGFSGQTITLGSGQIDITNSMTIDASTLPDGLIISGGNSSRIFNVATNVTATLKSLTIENGYTIADAGGGVRNNGTLTVLNCVFKNNSTQGGDGLTAAGGSGGGGGGGLGGAVYSEGPSLTLSGCAFENNAAEGGDGGSGLAEDGIYINGGDGGGPNGGPGASTEWPTTAPAGYGGGGGGGANGNPYGEMNASNGGFGGGGGGAAGMLANQNSTAPGGSGLILGGAGGASSYGGSGAGGGGAGLGGAVFTRSGLVLITNCSFAANHVASGSGGTGPSSAQNGGDGQGVGGAIFDDSASAAVTNCSFSQNAASSGYPDAFFLTNRVVTSPLDGLQAGTLRFWLAISPPGAAITVSPQLGGQIVNLTLGQIELSNNVSIDASTAPRGLFLNAATLSRVFLVDAGAVAQMNSLTLVNGQVVADMGGAICNHGTLTALNCTFLNNGVIGGAGQMAPAAEVGLAPNGGPGGGGAGMGGAIFSDGLGLTLGGCSFKENSARGGAGAQGGYNGADVFGSGGNGGGPNGAVFGSEGNNGVNGGFGGGGSGAGGPGDGIMYNGGNGGFGGGGGGGDAYPDIPEGGTGVGGLGGNGGVFGGAGGPGLNGVCGGGGGGAGLGGALFLQAGSATITNCSFSNNGAVAGHGGLGADSGQGYGGALYNNGIRINFDSVSFSGDVASTGSAEQYPSVSLSASNLVFGPDSGNSSVILIAADGIIPVFWTATADAPWLHLASSEGVQGQVFAFGYDANSGPNRMATIDIAGTTLIITQAGATYTQVPQTGTPLISQGVNHPWGVALDAAGNVYTTDTINRDVKKYNASSGVVTTLPIPGLGQPSGLALDAFGNIYIADTEFGTVVEWNVASSALAMLISGLNAPRGVTVDSGGNVYVTDSGNGALKEWSASGGNVTTLAQPPALKSPYGITESPNGSIYITDTGENQVLLFTGTATGGSLSSLLLNGLSFPAGVAADVFGNVLIADANNNVIKELNATNGTLTSLLPGIPDPTGVAVDNAGNIYVASFNTGSAVYEFPRAFIDATPRTEGNEASTDSLPAVLPSTQNLSPPFAPTSDQPWLTITGVANGVVSFVFSLNTTGVTRTAHIRLLGESITVSQGSQSPAVTTEAATAITATSATLNASATANGSATAVYFAYGLTTNYGSTNAVAAGSGDSATAVQSALTGLLPGMLYHFQAIASNNVGTAWGGDLTFTTALAPIPGSSTLAATENTAVQLAIGKLLAIARSSDNGALSIPAVNPLSAQGGSVSLGSSSITYTPPDGYMGQDQFTYSLSDGVNFVQGTVNVIVSSANQPSQNLASITMNGGCATVNFLGIPGVSYIVQWAASPAGPWTAFTPGITASAVGLISYTDCDQGITRFYRTSTGQ